LIRLVRSHAATVLGYPGPDAIGRDRPFKELGIDSLTAVELRNRIGAETGVRLSPTVVFDHPSPLRLAEYITARLGPEPDDETPVAPVRQVAAVSGERIDEMDIEALVAMVNNDFVEPKGEPR
jgi:acyl carrier protein